ncbi:MAG: hypothetical protein HC878_03585 [Leptolyngbyaceae cyanobacterium SL_5_14]|nr:hypothetical protein [Leptolyngbyaceae cyanobacterium SL_5_14]NJO66155.1 hypothetical protein [Leptolyngbyaceae cyanobacterium RM1_405_57]
MQAEGIRWRKILPLLVVGGVVAIAVPGIWTYVHTHQDVWCVVVSPTGREQVFYGDECN